MAKGIIQPKDMGDIIALQGLANYLHIDYWPVCEFIYPIMRNFPQFNAIILRGCNNWQRDYWREARNALFRKCKISEITDCMGYDILYPSKPRLDMFCDEDKYYQAGVPYEMKYDLFSWVRYEDKEDALYERLVKEKKYCVVHSYYGNDYKSRQSNPLEFETELPVIEMKPYPGYTVLDWYKILINASEIHMVDSSPANFVECANIQVEKTLHLYALTTTKMQPKIKSGFAFNNGWKKLY